MTATPEMVVSRLAERKAITDEMLLETAEVCLPTLIPAEHMVLVRKELNPKASRRGRPRKNQPSLEQVALALLAMEVANDLRPFLKIIADRLINQRRFTNDDYVNAASQKLQGIQYRGFMGSLYRDFRKLLDDAVGPVVHPIVGVCHVEAKESSPSGRALEYTQLALQRIGFDPPSIATMRNILSAERRRRKSTRKS